MKKKPAQARTGRKVAVTLDPEEIEDLHSDVAAIVRRQFIRLVDEIAAKLGGKRRGWQRAVAMTLGISPSFLSKVLNHEQPVGEETMRRIEERLKVPMGYFIDDGADPADALKDQYVIRTDAPRGKGPIREDDPPARTTLLWAHRQILSDFMMLGFGMNVEAKSPAPSDTRSEPDADLERRAKYVELQAIEHLRDVRFIQLLEAYRTAPDHERSGRQMALVVAFLYDVAYTLSWARSHREEPSLFTLMHPPDPPA